MNKSTPLAALLFICAVSYAAADPLSVVKRELGTDPGRCLPYSEKAIRRLTDLGAICEFSANPDSTNGSFRLAHSLSAGAANYHMKSRGTTRVALAIAGNAAPQTATVSMQADISAPFLRAQKNGGSSSQATSSQGTGNYSSQPLILFSRNGTSFFFAGHLYGLIIVGAPQRLSKLPKTKDG